MSQAMQTQIQRYGVAILAVTTALWLMLALNPWVPMTHTPFLLFNGAVIVGAWYGGFRPGLAATILAGILSDYFFLPPTYSWSFDAANAIRLSLFVLQGSLISALCHSLHRARRETEAHLRSLLKSGMALQESEARLQLAIEGADLGMWDYNFQTGQLICSKQCKAIFGLPADAEMTYAKFLDCVHPDDRIWVDRAVSQAIANRSDYNLEYRIHWPDGSLRWVADLGQAYPNQQNQPICMVGMSLDITERKQSEAHQKFLLESSALLAASLDFETTLNNLAHLAVPALADWCIVDIFQQDASVRQITIACADPNKQTLLETLRRQYPPNPQESDSMWSQLRQGDSILYSELTEEHWQQIAQDEAHLQLLKQLGRRSVMVVPLRSPQRVLGVISFVALTSRHRYTETDLALAEDIARRAATAIDNARLYQAAQEANQIKDEFLAVLSHELRTPLNPILGWTRLLRSNKLDAEKTAIALETIERNAKLQTQLIEDLLDVSRILRGKLNVSVTSVDLAATINLAIETVHLAAEAKSIQIQKLLSPDLIFVAGDVGRLQQVVWNLLSNAIKFSPPGSKVEVLLGVVNQQAQIQVRDFGQGISAEFLPHVFDYFRQADGTTTRQVGGLGLGLAIAQHLVEAHGGTIQVESPGLGQGATFKVRLPVQETISKPKTASDRSPNTSHPQPSLAGIQILVVDDEVNMRDFLTFLLQDAGATVIAVGSAHTALTTLNQWQPDILLSDIGLPEMDGYALIQHIRITETPSNQPLPAIALTAYAGEMNQQQAIAAGFQRHLAKPVEPDELLEAIISLVPAGTRKSF